MPSCVDIIEKEGVRRDVAANNTLVLDDPQGVWMVHEGTIDVFAVPRPRRSDGEVPPDATGGRADATGGLRRGARIHLCRLTAGDLLCGSRPSSEVDAELVAVGLPGSQVVRLERPQVEQLLKSDGAAGEFAELIDAWIDRLTSSVSRRRLPKEAQLLEPETTSTFPANTPVSPAQKVVWVVDPQPESTFLDRREITDERLIGLFPVAESGWITSQRESKVRCIRTADVLGDEKYWDGLQRFHELILQGAAENARKLAEADLQRLEDKTKAEERLTESALSQLAAAAAPDREAVATYDEDPLLAACRLVGEQQNQTFLAPKNYREKTWSDPVGVIARASAVRVRRVVLSRNWYRRDNGPLLGYRADNGQPVALLPTSTSSYDIVDPITHSRTPVSQATASNIQSFGYMFYRSFPAESLTLRDIIKFSLVGTKRDWLLLLVMGLAGGLLGLLVPLATGWIIGKVIPSQDMNQLGLIVLALIVTAGVAVLFEFIQGVAMMRLETRMDSSVEAGVWDRLLNLPASFFRQYTSGDLAMRAMGISQIRQAFTQTAASSVLTFLSSFVYFGLLFYYDSRLALLAVLLFVIIVTATGIATYYQLPHERDQHKYRGRVWGIVLQLVSGISRLRVAGAENRALAYWAKNYSLQTKSSIKSQMVSNNLESFMAALPIVAPLVIFASFALAPSGNLTVATFLAFNVAYMEIIMAAITMSSTISTALDVVPLFERATPILKTKPEYDRNKRDPGDLTGEIEMNHVSFRYHADSALVLEDVSLHINPGEFVAFVGPSGAGKSTVLRLLLGFEAPTTGSIYYDREDLAGLDALAVRQQIGVVLQDSRLQPGDIFSNIVGSAPLTHDDAWEAARMSGLDEDIRQMPMGMYTFLSDGESTLSGGQRQRLLIARAIVKKPPILFFDEATSALDNVTQAKVQQSLDNLKATRVVVAHRLSTIINADCIFVIDKGKIVQRGPYEELISQPGLFADLAKRQLI